MRAALLSLSVGADRCFGGMLSAFLTANGVTIAQSSAGITCACQTLTLRQADQARTDFALIEDQLEFIMGQLARVPTRAYLCRTLLLATASVGEFKVRGQRLGATNSLLPCGDEHDREQGSDRRKAPENLH